MDQLNDEWDFSSLPPEVMEKIFDFLTFRERLTVAGTCKRWYQTAFSPQFSRKMRIFIGNHTNEFREIHGYQNYRNVRVRVYTADIIKGNQSALADVLRAAPLENLLIQGTIGTIDTLLHDYLPSMNQLTALEMFVGVGYRGPASENVIRITHSSLKSLKIDGNIRDTTFEINCPSLTDLNLIQLTEDNFKKAVQLVIQLQQQLKSLDISVYENQTFQKLTNARLTNLKKLQLNFGNFVYGIKLSFSTMVNLVELHLYGNIFFVTVGEELSVLKNLSKLKLASMRMDTLGFEKALRKMEELHDLDLDGCAFISSTQPCNISLEHVTNLSIRGQDLLPRCKKLKSLKLFVMTDALDDIFEQVCNLYPLLEELHLGAESNGEFHFSKSFSHIKKLPLLKELHLTGLHLRLVNWTECSTMNIAVLHLNRCDLDDNGALQLMESVGPGLQQLFLNQCNRSKDVFDIAEKFVQLLRKHLPRCRISCEFSDKLARLAVCKSMWKM